MSKTTTLNGFNSQKAAQIAAWFAQREAGKIDMLKLMKLMYLAEREAIKNYDMPMIMDKYVSMKHGPVLSTTYDLAKGEVRDQAWQDWIEDVGAYKLACKPQSVEEFDALSRADILILEAVWKQFGSFKTFDLVEETHRKEVCPEWEDPGETSEPIPLKRILRHMNKDKSDEIAEEIEAYRNLSETLHGPD